MRLPTEERDRARLALIALTGIWGSTFVVLKSSLEHVSPLVLIAVRFAFAAAAIVAIRPSVWRPALGLLRATARLSVAMFIGYALQTVGLTTTTPARSAFLTSLSVLFVPLLELAIFRRLPHGVFAVSVFLAASGVFVLFQPIGLEWHRGDTLTLLSAIAFADYIVELAAVSRRHDAAALVLAQSLTIAALAAGAAFAFESPRFDLGAASIGGLLYLSVVCTTLVFLLMTWAQARTEPVEAAVIYTLEPVFAAAFSVALGREPWGWKLALGGVLVIMAMLLPGLVAPAVTTRAPQE